MKEKIKINPYVFPGLRKVSIKHKGERKYIGCGVTKEEVYEIIKNVCGITMEQIVSKDRHREIIDARHILCAILSKNFGITLKKIGQILGGRDHTTIVHSINMFEDRFETSEYYQEMVRTIYHKMGVTI
jgi:chromosomal replication initiator protein